MADASRKWIGRALQVTLVVVAVAFVVHWVRRHVHLGNHDTHVAAVAPPPDSLGPGDLRIYNADSSVDLVLVGDHIAAGLSPKTVGEVRRKMDSSSKADTGLGGSIASMIKHTVAGAIGTHVEFKLADLNDVRYDNGRLVFDWKKGSQHSILDDTDVNGKKASDTFLAGDAQRFIDAVHARQKELGLP